MTQVRYPFLIAAFSAVLLLPLLTGSLHAQEASLELIPYFADQSTAEITAVMTIVPTTMLVEAVSVAVLFDQNQFTVDANNSIKDMYFQQYGWDDASVPQYANNICIYGEYHPNFGAQLVLRGAPPTLCRFVFFNKSPGGTASFTVHGNGLFSYYFKNSVSGAQTFSPITNISNWAYPVELTTFTAAQQGQAIALRWVTATEENNYGFSVQRRPADAGAQEDWTTLDFVKGAGTSSRPSHYVFFDSDLPGEGEYAYRLKQQDFDGAASYSPVAKARFLMTPRSFGMQQNYPNPVSTSTGFGTTIPIDIAERSKVRLTIVNMLGQEVDVLRNDWMEAGRYNLTWKPSVLPAGTYIATLSSESGSGSERSTIRINVVR